MGSQRSLFFWDFLSKYFKDDSCFLAGYCTYFWLVIAFQVFTCFRSFCQRSQIEGLGTFGVEGLC